MDAYLASISHTLVSSRFGRDLFSPMNFKSEDTRCPTKFEPRERYGEGFWRKHHEAWQQSALNQRKYCEAHGIPLRAFGNCGRGSKPNRSCRSANCSTGAGV